MKTAKESRSATGYSTQPGFVNRNGQEVIRNTDLEGTDHMQKVYELRCSKCGHVYGANGTDIHARRCPKHDGGRPGISIN